MSAEVDIKTHADLYAYIESCADGGARFHVEAVPHTEARNAYYARYRLQKHYNGEQYQL